MSTNFLLTCCSFNIICWFFSPRISSTHPYIWGHTKQPRELYIWCRLAPIHVGRDRVAMRTFRKTNVFTNSWFHSLKNSHQNIESQLFYIWCADLKWIWHHLEVLVTLDWSQGLSYITQKINNLEIKGEDGRDKKLNTNLTINF